MLRYVPGIYKQDAGAAFPRFVLPSEPCPVSTFAGHIRQISRLGTTPGERGLLSAAFGGFSAQFAAPGEVAAWVERLNAGDEPARQLLAKVPRRFAGDDTLPPGRYSTLCADAEGDDGGTLSREMRFYTNATAAAAHIEIYDPVLPGARAILQRKGLGSGDGGRLYLLVIPFDQGEVRETPLGFWTGVDVEGRRIAVDGVLDLRRPAAALWLATAISQLEFEINENERLRCFPFRPDVNSVREILPALADQAKGGGNFHTIAGLLLRQLGVAGLVFPSVRGDFRAECADHVPLRSAGWTFLDYRGAPSTDVNVFFDLRPGWPTSLTREGGDDGGRTPVAFGNEVRFVLTSVYEQGTGGIAAVGLEQRHEAINAIDTLAALLRRQLPDEGEPEVSTLLQWLQSLDATDACRGATLALYAALGMRDARRDLAALLESSLGDTPAAGGLRACLRPPRPLTVAGTEFLGRWFKSATDG
jgi:hypothetical protein